MTPDEIRALPKAELHVHLDGSLRAGTLAALAADRGVDLPAAGAAVADDPDRLADYMVVDDATSLAEYLERFEVTLAVMQDREAIRRIARECVEDHRAEGVRYLEIRYCPELNTARGLRASESLDAALEGIADAGGIARSGSGNARSSDPPSSDPATGHAPGPLLGDGCITRVIVCGLRSHAPETTLEMARLAVEYRDRGVCGFDLAGGEDGNPVRDHVAAFDHAAKHGLPITIHAGEGYGPASIRQALQAGHARRIGHGTRLFEDPALESTVQRAGIPLEVCLTSNVQTGVVPSIADHPAGKYIRAGIEVVLGTDNRLMSGVDLTGEYLAAIEAFDLNRAEVLALARSGFRHAFVDREARDRMVAAFDAAVA